MLSRKQRANMLKPLNPEYARIVDDIYLAYVCVLSTADEVEFADVIEEYSAPADGSALVPEDDTRRRSGTTLRIPGGKVFGRAA